MHAFPILSEAGLPQVMIDTHGTPIKRRDRVPASLAVTVSSSEGRCATQFCGKGAVAVRGSVKEHWGHIFAFYISTFQHFKGIRNG